MRIFRLSFALLLASLLPLQAANAQLAAPGPGGIVMGHIHIVTRDLEAHRHFWTTLGGVPMKNGGLEIIRFPGGYVALRQGDSTAGTVGSAINHVGFEVKSVAESLPKWQAAGLKLERQISPVQLFLTAPDDIRVEILENATISTPVRVHHIHFFVPDPLAAQAWYVKTLGAVAGKRGPFDAADLPGINLSFSKADMPQAPTKGRALDHVGFEAIGLEARLKKLEGEGMTLDQKYQRSAVAPLMLAYIVDPWGAYVEMTEGLEPK